jgi:hypothetical protein
MRGNGHFHQVEPATGLDDLFRDFIAHGANRTSGAPAPTTDAKPLSDKGDGVDTPSPDAGSSLESRLDTLSAKVAELDERIVGLIDAHDRQLRALTTSIDELSEQIAKATTPASEKVSRALGILGQRRPRPIR